MSGLKINTAWITNVVSIADFKAFARLDSSDSTENSLIESLIFVAQDLAEQFTNRAITYQILQLFLDKLPFYNDIPLQEGIYTGVDLEYNSNFIVLPKPNLISVDHVKYYADDNCSDSGGVMNVASGSTSYSSDSNTEYTIDLGSAQNVQGYGFYSSYGSASKNVTAKLYYSDDGSSWTEDESNSISTRSSDACGEYNRYRGTAGLGQDDSGNGNHFTLNNIDTTNQSTDTPTNNFCTLNFLLFLINFFPG